MKRIGTTNEGKILAEFDPGEWAVLERLADATSGYKTISFYVEPNLEIPLQGPFAAIKNWIESDYRVTELRAIADKMDEWLKKKNESNHD